MTSNVRIVRQVELAAAMCLTVNVAATLPLWTGRQSLPQIPWVSWLIRIDTQVAGSQLVCAAAGLAVAMVCPFWRPGDGRANAARQAATGLGRSVFAVCAIGLCLLSQQRLQPWAYQSLLFLGVCWLAPATSAPRLLRCLVLGIYSWSAISKLDAAFAAGLGQRLLTAVEEALGLVRAPWGGRPMSGLALLLPAGELLAAGLLASRRTRRAGCVGAALMHGLLLAGFVWSSQGHRWPVSVWNVVFLVQVWVLFWPHSAAATRESSGASVDANNPADRSLGLWGARAIVGLGATAPALNLGDWWDHWPAWSLYSARPEIVRVSLEDSAAERVPRELRAYLGPLEFHSDRRAFNFDRWSYTELGAPLYPQGRFRAAVALAAARRFQWGTDVTVEVESSPDRWTGKRDVVVLRGEAELAAFCAQSRVNSQSAPLAASGAPAQVPPTRE